MPRPLAGAAISFGLVTIPVKLYRATQSLSPSFHLVHRTCGTRIREQIYCPKHERVVSRDEVVRGYEIAKDRLVAFTPEELKALEATASRTIDIQEFVPLPTVDPIYIEGTTFLGPDRGGDRAYRLLADVMRDRNELALGTYVMRGKENLVAIRAYQRGLILHTLYFADEIRDFTEIELGKGAVRPEEMQLALRLVEALRRPAFDPERFEDTYRARVEKAARAKARGKVLPEERPAEARGTVVNLMEALQESLKRKRAGPGRGQAAGRGTPKTPARRVAAS
jgi:DNA end-binding protein Ku